MSNDEGASVRRRRRLLLYIHGLSGGGAERVWCVLASALAARGHDVTLAADYSAGAHSTAVDPRVTLELLGENHATAVWRLAGLIRRLAPDVALSAVSSSNFKLCLAKLTARSRCPIVISYHGFAEHQSGRLGWLGVAGMRVLSRIADRTVGVSDALTADLIKSWQASPSRTMRLYNPVEVGPVSTTLTLAELSSRPDTIVSVGRLVRDKAVDVTIRAFARMQRPSARLVILGDGPERPTLEALARDLNIANQVEFAGFQSIPWPYYARAKVLAHASRAEAFGNIVVEAMAYGLAVVATRCAGPAELLENGRYGALVAIDDEAAMAAAMAHALDAPGDPAPRLARAATFSADAGAAAYEALIETILAERKR